MLAADEEDEGDIALQIHFTLIQAFCCENDIDIVRVGDVQRLAAIVGAGDEAGAPGDLHCILISVSVLPRLLGPPPQARVAPVANLADLCAPPAEPPGGRMEGPRLGKAQPVLRREPQRERLGAQYHPPRVTAGGGPWSDLCGGAPERVAPGWLCGGALGGRLSSAWRLASRAVECQEEARLLPRRGPGGGRGGLAQSPGLYKCGEPVLAPEGLTLAAVLGRTKDGWTGRAGVTQQPAPWAGSRGKARPGGLDLHSYWSSDRPSSLHYCFKRDPGDASFSKGLCSCSFDFYNKLTETNLLSLLRAGGPS